MYKLEFTKEEIDATLIQIGARLDDLAKIQKEAGKEEDIKEYWNLKSLWNQLKLFDKS